MGQVPTLEDINALEVSGIINTINYVRSEYKMPNPFVPIKPKKLGSGHVNEDAEWFEHEMKTYEKMYAEYEAYMVKYNEHERKLDKVINEFLKYETDLESVPEKYRDKVWDTSVELSNVNINRPTEDAKFDIELQLTVLHRLVDIFG